MRAMQLGQRGAKSELLATMCCKLNSDHHKKGLQTRSSLRECMAIAVRTRAIATAICMLVMPKTSIIMPVNVLF